MLMEEENRQIIQYAKEQQEREMERMAEEKKSEEAKAMVYQKVSDVMSLIILDSSILFIHVRITV